MTILVTVTVLCTTNTLGPNKICFMQKSAAVSKTFSNPNVIEWLGAVHLVIFHYFIAVCRSASCLHFMNKYIFLLIIILIAKYIQQTLLLLSREEKNLHDCTWRFVAIMLLFHVKAFSLQWRRSLMIVWQWLSNCKSQKCKCSFFWANSIVLVPASVFAVTAISCGHGNIEIDVFVL